jgi:menaquinone-dependent protoporphyrinogen oxidase
MTRVLVAVGSKHGGTAAIADAIAATLREHGIEAERHRASDVGDLSYFDAVILGSAIYMNGWQAEAIDVLKRLEREPFGGPVWLFSSGPTGGAPEADAKVAEVLAAQPPPPGEAGKRARRLAVRGHVTFGGRIPDEMRGFFERWMPRGDWRDFRAIRDWTAMIARDLSVVSTRST